MPLCSYVYKTSLLESNYLIINVHQVVGNAGFFMSNWEVKGGEMIICVMLLKVKPISDMQLNIIETEQIEQQK